MNNKKKIYISGPISGHDIEERRAAFAAVESMLREEGLEVVNPLNVAFPEDCTHEQYMRVDIALLIGCDYIYLMEGWMESYGCVAEMHVAKSAGIKVLHNEEESKFKDVDVALKVTIPVPHGVLSDVLGVDAASIGPVHSTEDEEDE